MAKRKSWYKIVIGESLAGPDDAKQQAETETNLFIDDEMKKHARLPEPEPIGIAADCMTRELEGTTKDQKWVVYVLIRLHHKP
jgi:hypothetical protein